MESIKQSVEDSPFGNIISVYTQDEALADGTLIKVGETTNGQNVVFTSNLFYSGGYADYAKRQDLIFQGLAMLKTPDPEDTEYMMLRVIEKNAIWMIVNGDGITFLKPEDY